MSGLQPLLAQFKFQGKVTSALAEKYLSNANVVLKGTKFRTQTNADGQFLFPKVPAGNYELQVSFVGYQLFVKNLQIVQNQEYNVELVPLTMMSEEVVVKGTRATKEAATTFTNLDKKEIEKSNFGQDLPFVLQNTVNAVVNSDAGAGVGYTGLRIRGSDGQRTNVTINGIPYNDSESAGSFFVNLPDFSSSVNTIQIQRGVGTSTNGAGAFGASINVQTASEPEPLPSVEINNTVGSFQTFKNTLQLSSGLINEKFSFDARLSRISSKGYVDRGASDLKSFFVSGAFHGKKDLIRLNIFSGKEKTYQSWNGVDESLVNDRVLRRSNVYTYPNQTDNYTQTNYQFLYNRDISNQWSFNGALHLTRGAGYYEEYKKNQNLADYGLNAGTAPSTSDLIRQRWLDNYFYGLTYNLNYQPNSKFHATFGGAYNQYKGGHFGEVIWAQNYPLSLASQNFHRYYDNDGNKNEFNAYLKLDYELDAHWLLFADLQYRDIGYQIIGPDENFKNLNATYQWSFFNPKAGVTYKISPMENMYLSYSQANKEPIRSDVVTAQAGKLPTPERLHDVEMGYRMQRKTFAINANAYGMFYHNQLVETGAINNVGAAIRQNVPQSYRMGIELEGGVQLISQLRLNANVALSRNKIKSYTQYINNDDDLSVVAAIPFKNTNIAFSPSVVSFAELVYHPIKHLELAWQFKYVGKQYLDNTENQDRTAFLPAGSVDNLNRKIDAYGITNLRLGYDVSVYGIKNIHFGLLVNNLFDKLYVANGYSYNGYSSNTFYAGNGFYPQATTNFLFSMNVKF